tara:strand:+ start:3742 stop:3909 length:168 start_codon:yes stop_codon:yes gene_type:complete
MKDFWNNFKSVIYTCLIILATIAVCLGGLIIIPIMIGGLLIIFLFMFIKAHIKED